MYMSSPEDPYNRNPPPFPYPGGPDPDPGLPRRPFPYPDPNDTYAPPHYNPDDTQPIPVYDPNASGPLFPEASSTPPEKPGRFAALGHKVIEIAAAVTEKPVAKLAGALAAKGAVTGTRGEDMQERDPNKPTRSMRTQRRRMLSDAKRAAARHQRAENRATTEAPALFKNKKGFLGLARIRAYRHVRKQAAMIEDDAAAVRLYKGAEGVIPTKKPGRGHRKGPGYVIPGDINPNAVGIDNPFYSEGVTRRSFDEPVGRGEQPLKSSMPGVRRKAAAAARARANYEQAVEEQVDRMEGSRRSQRIERRNDRRGERRIAIGGALQGLGEGLAEVAEGLAETKERRRAAGRYVHRARNARRRYDDSPEVREAKQQAKDTAKAQKEADKAAAKNQRDAEKQAAKAQSDAEKEANRKAKEAAKAAKEAAKKAKKNPSPDSGADPDNS